MPRRVPTGAAAPRARRPAKAEPIANQNRRSLGSQERSRQTRDDLVRVAVALWNEKGYENTTVKDITAAAGVAWSTFYFHFPSKTELLQHLASMTADALYVETADILETGTSLEQQLLEFCERIRRRVERIPRQLLSQIISGTLPGIADAGGHPPSEKRSFDISLAAIFREGIRTGELPKDSDALEMGAVFTAMILEGLLRWSVGTASHDKLGDVLTFRAELFLHGVSVPTDRAARAATRRPA